MRARGSFSAFIMLLLTLQCHVEHQTVSSHRGETGKKNCSLQISRANFRLWTDLSIKPIVIPVKHSINIEGQLRQSEPGVGKNADNPEQ